MSSNKYHAPTTPVYCCRLSDGSLTPVKQVGGEDWADTNKWFRQDIELESSQQFQVVIEATIGWPGESDIAIDDVSFTPACQ